MRSSLYEGGNGFIRPGIHPASARTKLPCSRLFIIVIVRFSLLCLVLAAVVCSACYHGSKPSGIDIPAPDFTIRDSDRSVTLSQLRGKTVVLNFWATWCPPCLEEMPSLVRMQKLMKDKAVTVVAVSVDDDASDYHKFLKEHDIDLLTVRESGRRTEEGVIAPVSSRYGTLKVPETYIIDRKGIIRRKFIGAVDWGQPEIVEYLSRL
jgi:cytochrome c biogenesis protein CcmG, thiol:disulfide interchange protein DsbE